MILSLGIWEEEDTIAIDSDIPCVIYAYITRPRLPHKEGGAYEAEVDLEPASYLSSEERGYVEVVEAGVMEFITAS